MAAMKRGQLLPVLLVWTLADATALILLVSSILGWIDIPIVIPILLLIAGNGLMVGFLVIRRDQ